MMNFAQELVANREKLAEANKAEKASYGVTVEAAPTTGIPKNLRTKEVPQELARKSPELAGLGKVSRRKTDNPLVKELLANGEVIGQAEDTRKTEKCWTVTINGTTIKAHTINKAIRKFGDANA